MMSDQIKTLDELDEIIKHASTTYNVIYSKESCFMALKTINRMIHSDNNEITDKELINYINKFLQNIGIK